MTIERKTSPTAEPADRPTRVRAWRRLLPRPGRWLRGLLGLGAVTLVASVSGGIAGLEHWAYGRAMRHVAVSAEQPDIVIVAVDHRTEQAFGHWPPSPELLARFHRAVSKDLPRLVAYAWPLGTGQRGAQWDALAAALTSGAPATVGAAYGIGPGRPTLSQVALLNEHALKPHGRARNDAASRVEWIDMPSVAISTTIPLGLGPEDRSRAPDEVLYEHPLVLHYGSLRLPSFELVAAAAVQGLDASRIRLGPKVIEVGTLRVPTEGHRMRPFFHSRSARVVSFGDVLNGRTPAGTFAGKLVLVGPGEGVSMAFSPTPIGVWMRPIELSAQVLSSLLDGTAVRLPAWRWAVAALFWIGALALVLFGLPRLNAWLAWPLALGAAAAPLGAEALALGWQSVWIPLAWPAALVLLGLLWSTVEDLSAGASRRLRSQLDTVRRQWARSLQEQGRLEEAFTLLRDCDRNEDWLDQLYQLGLELERRRLYARAVEAFRLIAATRGDYKDAEQRAERNQRQLDGIHLPGKTSAAEDPLGVSTGLQKPTLGRYQVDRVLGKGEMGIVYLGHDPRINRQVAIKTMALSDEFDADVIEDVRARFFREASAAGKLNHPHIVTIYDVGEEAGLAYIAMDYLTGKPLSNFTKKDTLLPVADVVRIGIQVAAALDSAHQNQVVHRDIKPANIIYDVDKRHATVTDFGVAAVTDTTKTRTGIILGTPAFMSPEQVAGRRVDGRSDIFSLAVTLFQLLTGTRAFTGDSVATLMYRIAREPHPNILELRPDLPECLKAVLDKALAKDPAERFQRAGLLGTALRRCLRAAMSHGQAPVARRGRARA